MSTQTEHWRKYAIKLITLLKAKGATNKEIAKELDLDEESLRVIHSRWSTIYHSKISKFVKPMILN